MSKELKTYDLPVDHGDFTSTVELFFLKSEADKVIAHQKYKRCLARSVIAEMNAIHFKDLFYGEGSESLADEYNKQITIHYKWHNRWRELAEKFKEAK